MGRGFSYSLEKYFLYKLPVKFGVPSAVSDFSVSLLLLMVVELAEWFWWLAKPTLSEEKILKKIHDFLFGDQFNV